MGTHISRFKSNTTIITLLLFFSVLVVDLSLAHGLENPLIQTGQINSGVSGIIIKAKDVSLDDLLGKIKSQSGIDFRINKGLLDTSISVETEATNWTEAVQKILQDYNRVELWGQDQKLTGVYVMGLLNPEGHYMVEPSLKGNTDQVAGDNSLTTDEDIALSKGQLGKLVQGRYRSPLSPKLWEDEQLRLFLNQQGVSRPEDLKNLKKAMTVRWAARKQLQELRKNK